MGGITGRSKVCLDCRQRKEKLPACKNCINGGRTNEEYTRDPAFLSRTGTGVAKRKNSEEARRSYGTASKAASSSKAASTTAQQSELSSDHGTFLDSAFFQPGTGAACEAQLFSTFWDHYTPQQSVQAGCQCKWLQQALDIPSPSPALRLSLKALATARIGWIHRDDRLIHNGREFYGQALQAIQRALYDESTMWHDETLATGNVLGFYEFYEPTNESVAGWNSHTDGVVQLMLLRGADRHRSPFGRALLEGIRLSAMTQALQNRKASPLGCHEWCTRPWMGQKRKERYPEKDSTQWLYDHGFALAALFEDIDTADLPNPKTTISQFNKYLRRCSALDATFNLWYQNFARNSSTPLYWLTPPNDGVEYIPAAIDRWRPFSFPNLHVAITIITFWGLKLALSNTIAIICALVLTPNAQNLQRNDETQGFAALEQTARLLLAQHGGAGRLENATRVVRAMPYCLHDSTGLLGPHRSLFALRAALLSLRRTPGEELDRCLGAYQELVEKTGMGYAREVGKVNGKGGVAAGENTDAIRLAPGHGE